MKKAIVGITLVFMAIISIAFITKDKVPQVVKDSFSKKFPKVKRVDWEKEEANEWEAEFKLKKKNYSANFLDDGTWQETEYEIEEKEVPEHIISSIMDSFPGYEIEEAEVSETVQGVNYEFEIEKGKSEMAITIDSNGKIIHKESEDDDERD
ncbi:PepSY-like domain-containing protein [Sinomicrobium oceani]|uniref:PepSY-like domain-containing protein n=1 Tax=Sinomicrobium oceani TaxID=1150368 RepID=UPI00227D2E55|nr:PepSY-like domain-containing protein [Sinomicrobium oceani]